MKNKDSDIYFAPFVRMDVIRGSAFRHCADLYGHEQH
jgi:hypothetical protein